MKALNLLFFYLVGEEQYDQLTEDIVGYIRVVDLETRKTIEKVEVSRLRETFTHLRSCLSKAAEPVDYDYPKSEQCFAVKWDKKVMDKIDQSNPNICLICKEISNYIQNYRRFLKESGRFATVS